MQNISAKFMLLGEKHGYHALALFWTDLKEFLSVKGQFSNSAQWMRVRKISQNITNVGHAPKVTHIEISIHSLLLH